MPLSVRPKPYILPSYSLTGDLIGYLRCGLQYRYTRIGNLPSSRPVQLWFGEFIHGVLEEAYRRYQDSVKKGAPRLPPWPQADLDAMCDLIGKRLAARGLVPWSDDLEKLGKHRAEAAVQELGPHLFPLIHQAEVRLTGARMLPIIPAPLQFRVADRYEMVGRIDVVSHIQMRDPSFKTNPIIQEIVKALPPGLPPTFEVIIDYKGMRRPPFRQATPTVANSPSLWTQYEWQIQTYGELRRRQVGSYPVVAGVLLYLNELYPTSHDIEQLKAELASNTTDVAPASGSEAAKQLHANSASLPFGFRLSRAMRVVPITTASIQNALQMFDQTVCDIETCRGREVHGTSIRQAWTKNASHEDTCVACDSRTFCPDYMATYPPPADNPEPRLPGVKKKP